MLKVKNRLTKDKEISLVFKTGKSCYLNNIGVKAIFTERDFSRFGFLISKKVSKRAVVRNKLKRQIKAVVLENLPNWRVSSDVLFVCQPGLNDQSFEEIKNTLNEIFKKLNLIKHV
jgi:ribonuclease P protein component